MLFTANKKEEQLGIKINFYKVYLFGIKGLKVVIAGGVGRVEPPQLRWSTPPAKILKYPWGGQLQPPQLIKVSLNTCIVLYGSALASIF